MSTFIYSRILFNILAIFAFLQVGYRKIMTCRSKMGFKFQISMQKYPKIYRCGLWLKHVLLTCAINKFSHFKDTSAKFT